MAITDIEWCDYAWNPIRGCSRVSDECINCYAEKIAQRFSGKGHPFEGLIARTGQWNGKIKIVPEKLTEPLRWKKPRKIFVNSMSDLFHENVPVDFIHSVFAIMALCPQHTFIVLTKRAQRMRELLSKLDFKNQSIGRAWTILGSHPHYCHSNVLNRPWPLPNVWLGVSTGNQQAANERIPQLLQTPAAVRFISAEPLLSEINLHKIEAASSTVESVRFPGNFSRSPLIFSALTPSDFIGLPGLDWVIAGGESGHSARPMHPQWVRQLRDQCESANVPFFFKQWGEWQVASAANGHHESNMENNKAHWLDIDGTLQKPSVLSPKKLSINAYAMVKVGKKQSGNTLDGQTLQQFPA